MCVSVCVCVCVCECVRGGGGGLGHNPSSPRYQGAGWRRGAWPGGGGRGALTPRRRAGAALPAAPPCELATPPAPPAPSPPQPPRPREYGAVSSELLLGQRPKTGSSYPPPPAPPPRAFPSCYFLGTQIGFYENRRAESGSSPSRPFLPS